MLLGQIRDELARIYDGIEAVCRQMRVSDEAISRLVRQQTDTRYRTMLDPLEPTVRAPQRGCENPYGRRPRPYDTATSAHFRAIADAPGQIHGARATAPGLGDLASEPAVDSGPT